MQRPWLWLALSASFGCAAAGPLPAAVAHVDRAAQCEHLCSQAGMALTAVVSSEHAPGCVCEPKLTSAGTTLPVTVGLVIPIPVESSGLLQ